MRLLMLVTVGTSIKENFEKWIRTRTDRKTPSEEELWAKIKNKSEDYGQFVSAFINYAPDIPKFKYPSAEIQSLWFFFEHKLEEGWTVDEIVLYYAKTKQKINWGEAETGRIAAEAVKDLIGKMKDRYNRGIHKGTKVKTESFGLTDISEPENFKDGVADLFIKIHEQIKEARKDSTQVVLNITGGYKALVPFTSLLGFLEREIKTIYGFEEAERVIAIPTLPLIWDYRTLDEFGVIFRGLVKEGIGSELYKVLYPKVKGFFDYNENKQEYLLNAFGKLVSEKYQQERYRRYGYGIPLLDEFKNHGLREKLESKLNEWEHLWLGDQIPETVEHARYHSHRLLELAYYFLKFTELQLSDEELFLLISSIWLHDIGHSQLSYKLPSGYNLRIAEFPTLVRKWHNLFSSHRIEEKELLDDKATSNSVALICKYHRNKMPLFGNDSWKEKIFDKISVEPLAKFLDREELKVYGRRIDKEKIFLVASLLRFIDACDVQADRVVTEEYRRAREARTDEEIRYYLELLEERKTLWANTPCSSKFDSLHKEIKEFGGKYANLKDMWGAMTKEAKKEMEDEADHIQDEIIKELKKVMDDNKISLIEKQQLIYSLGLLDKVVFKKEQERHFIKHSGIKVVYLGKETDGIAIYLVAGEDASKEDVEDVAKEIYEKEYKGKGDRAKSTEEVFKRYNITVTKVYGIIRNEKEVLCPNFNRSAGV